jgi:hypothetical protein
MIVSPGDVIQERTICRDTIVEWNAIYSEKGGIILNPIGWEINSYPETGKHPQDILNRQLLEKADILLAIFWTRIGTPTKEYPSGSIEEISKHIESGKPALIYFSKAPVIPGSYDQDQFEKLQEYQKSIQDKSYYKKYPDIAGFKSILSKDIQLLANDKLERYSENDTAIDVLLTNNGKEANNIIKSLSDTAKQLLKETASGGTGQIFIAPTLSVFIVQNDFGSYQFNNSDGEAIADIEDSLDQLEAYDLIKQNDSKGEVFRVTTEGYKLAKLII